MELGGRNGCVSNDIEHEIALKKEEMKKQSSLSWRYDDSAFLYARCWTSLFIVTKQINDALESYRKRVKVETGLKELNASLRFKITKALEESKQKDKALLAVSFGANGRDVKPYRTPMATTTQ